MGFIKSRDDDETANLIWNDSAVQHEKIAELRNYQVCRTLKSLAYLSWSHSGLSVRQESYYEKVDKHFLRVPLKQTCF